MFGLRGKLLLIAGSVCLIPCLFFIAIVYTQVTDNYMLKLEEDLQISADLKAVWMETWCDEIVNGVETLASRSVFRGEVDVQELRTFLDQQRASFNAESVAFVAPSGISSVNTDNKELDLTGRAYVQEALRGRTSPGGVVVSQGTGNSIFAAAAPITDNGQVLGAIIMTRNVQDGINLFNKAYSYQSRNDFLLNPDRKIMTEGRLSVKFRLSNIDTLPAQEVSNGSSGSGIYVSHRDVEVVGAWIVSKYGWGMVEEVETSEALAPVFELMLLLVGVISGMIIVALSFAYYFSGSIARPIRKIAHSANQLAEGNLSEKNKVQVKSKDEVGKLAVSFNKMIDNMRELIASVKQSANDVGEKANNISVSSNEVAASNTEQANIAQEVSQAITELSKATEAIAANAHSAQQSGDNAFKEAQESSKSIREAIGSLNAIKDAVNKLGVSSKRIGEIVSVIDDIADQTNLLALNAAIEAARAGEHGKSFTVVAEAIGSLAERSSNSTKEIARLVGDTQQQIQDAVTITEKGVDKADQAVETLDNIVNQIDAVASKVGEISAVGEEQAASSEEVTASIESLSAASEEVSASSQEMAGSAKILSRLGQELRNLVDRFTNV